MYKMNTDMINALLKIAEGITEFANAHSTPHQDKPNPLVLVSSVVKINDAPTTVITSDENDTYVETDFETIKSIVMKFAATHGKQKAIDTMMEAANVSKIKDIPVELFSDVYRAFTQ
jgi:hypothetical protein